MSEIVTEEVVVEDEAVVEEQVATDVAEGTSEEELEETEDELEEGEVELEEGEVDEEVESDDALVQPAADLHPGRLAPALVGPSHHDLNPAFAPR